MSQSPDSGNGLATDALQLADLPETGLSQSPDSGNGLATKLASPLPPPGPGVSQSPDSGNGLATTPGQTDICLYCGVSIP